MESLPQLEVDKKSTDVLVDSFLKQISSAKRYSSARKLLDAAVPLGAGPTELMKEISEALSGGPSRDLAQTIIRGIAFCLAEAPHTNLPGSYDGWLRKCAFAPQTG